MKTAIVTGAGGFIGGALTKRLLDKGYKVYGVDIYEKFLQQFKDYKAFIPICIDLTNNKLSENINETVDVIFYLAWGGTLLGSDLNDTSLQTENIKVAVKTCEDIIDKCKHYIFCGSTSEFTRDINTGGSYINIYGIAKESAAKMCKSIAYKNNVKFNKAILPNTFGYGDKSKKAVNTLLGFFINNKIPTLVEGNKKNDWMYIDDTIDGLICIHENGCNNKDYYIGHRNITTFKEKLKKIRDILAPNMELTFGGMKENTYVDYSLIDLEALHNDTGFECKTDFKESIIKTVKWLKMKTKEDFHG